MPQSHVTYSCRYCLRAFLHDKQVMIVCWFCGRLADVVSVFNLASMLFKPWRGLWQQVCGVKALICWHSAVLSTTNTTPGTMLTKAAEKVFEDLIRIRRELESLWYKMDTENKVIRAALKNDLFPKDGTFAPKITELLRTTVLDFWRCHEENCPFLIMLFCKYTYRFF